MALSPRSTWYDLDLGVKADEADLADESVLVAGGICHQPGTIREVWVGMDVLPTVGTLAVAKSAATDVNVLGVTTIDLAADIVIHVAEKATLSTNANALRVAAGDIIIATWTLTDVTEANDSVFNCKVLIEPDLW